MEGNEMSLTPDRFFNGESVCTACDKPMFANDTGVVYRPQKAKDFMFCIECATQMTMSIAQDISKLNPDIGLSYYFRFKSPGSLYRHANALKELAANMETQASCIFPMPHPNEDK
jgi:hypothetical protein